MPAHRTVTAALAFFLAAVFVASGLGAPSAAAEGIVVASEPQERQELTQMPGAVTLAFTDVVDAGVAKLLVLNSEGENVTSGELIVEGTNVTSYLRDGLAKGTYTVQYRVDRADGQPQGGAFQFAYGPGSWTKLEKKTWSGQENEPPIMQNRNPNATDTEPPGSDTSTSVPDVEVTSDPTATTEPPKQTNEPVDPTEPAETSTSPGATEVATPTPAAGPEQENSSPVGWILGGLVVLAAVAAGAVWFSRRGRPRP